MKENTIVANAETFLSLAQRFSDQTYNKVLTYRDEKGETVKNTPDRDELSTMIDTCKIIATDERPDRPTRELYRREIDLCFRSLEGIRIRWQAVQITELLSSWLNANIKVYSRNKAEEKFRGTFGGKIDTWFENPDHLEPRRLIQTGFELMDLLRAPFGRCPECPRRGRSKRPNPLTASKSGQVFQVCHTCYQEKMAALNDRPATTGMSAPNREKASHSKASRRHRGNLAAHSAERSQDNKMRGKKKK